ncbi:hypothetical protein QBC46DRAFT_462636 [Diplogelasinospora grovesii]|uniref:Uncharacterized protein n=1 Tax=Diplogelasinospora grovesii TaxID=303347 RepID=A0AAN6MXP9_9PEZI|nr:hypothetical protein QBC46DRAFT_462636 [Diplogelasinospora grovesii]
MDGLNFDWLDGDYNDLNFDAPELLSSDSPRVNAVAESSVLATQEAGPVAERVDQPSGKRALPLLRLSDWDRSKAREIFSGDDFNLVLAPSDFWTTDFKPRLETLLKNKKKLPGNSYTCEKALIHIGISNSRQRGLKTECMPHEIDWELLDSHLEGLSALFVRGRKITFNMKFIYKEDGGDQRKGKTKKRSATEAQKQERATEAGFWARFYEHHRCKRVHCDQGPHCLVDNGGNHRRLLPVHLEASIDHIRRNMKDGEIEETVSLDIPPEIRDEVLKQSKKRKPDSPIDCRRCKARVSDHRLGSPGDVEGIREDKLEEYWKWTETQVKSEGWREALRSAFQVAVQRLLDLNTMLRDPKSAAGLMVKCGVEEGAAMQFVTNVRVFQRETKKS